MHLKLHKHFSIQQWGMLQLILSLHTQIYCIFHCFGVQLLPTCQNLLMIIPKRMFYTQVYYIEDHVVLQVFQCVLKRKACYTPFMQCVLNRKACYTPVVPKCIKSKSMLYINKPMCIKSKSMLYTSALICINPLNTSWTRNGSSGPGPGPLKK